MDRFQLLTVVVFVMLVAVCKPGHTQADDVVAYKPDILGVNRLFLVALKVPPNAGEIKIAVPDTLNKHSTPCWSKVSTNKCPPDLILIPRSVAKMGFLITVHPIIRDS